MTEWKPGTVAVATVRGVFNVQVVRCLAYDTPQWFCPLYQESDERNGWWPDDDEVTDVRPLVVLDLERLSPSGPQYVADLLRHVVAEANGVGGWTLKKIADEIERQTRPPKPAEPKGLGAVVEDAKGGRWTNTGQDMPNRWACATDFEWGDYADIDAVKVLSEGVQS